MRWNRQSVPADVEVIYNGEPGQARLSQNVINDFMLGADERDDNTPSIFDLEEAIRELSRAYPVEARAALVQLRWLTKTANRRLGKNWKTPWG